MPKKIVTVFYDRERDQHRAKIGGHWVRFLAHGDAAAADASAAEFFAGLARSVDARGLLHSPPVEARIVSDD